MTLSAHEVKKIKHAATVGGVLPIIRERFSPRSYADRDVPQADLETVFEAARWAASSYNEQPWRYLVGTRGSDTYKKIVEALMPFNRQWAGKAPVLILGVAKKKFSHNDTPNAYAIYDLGAASSYLTLQAAALGLATHQMAGFDKDAARKLLEIPEEFDLGAVIALGYQGEPEQLTNEQMLKQETSPRERKGVGDFVFTEWGKGFKGRD
jgi:nitroreductase